MNQELMDKLIKSNLVELKRMVELKERIFLGLNPRGKKFIKDLENEGEEIGGYSYLNKYWDSECYYYETIQYEPEYNNLVLTAIMDDNDDFIEETLWTKEEMKLLSSAQFIDELRVYRQVIAYVLDKNKELYKALGE
jgi:hypothetical protein